MPVRQARRLILSGQRSQFALIAGRIVSSSEQIGFGFGRQKAFASLPFALPPLKQGQNHLSTTSLPIGSASFFVSSAINNNNFMCQVISTSVFLHLDDTSIDASACPLLTTYCH